MTRVNYPLTSLSAKASYADARVAAFTEGDIPKAVGFLIKAVQRQERADARDWIVRSPQSKLRTFSSSAGQEATR